MANNVGLERFSEHHPVPGLAEALFKGDQNEVERILFGVQIGERIEVWGKRLWVDKPTSQEEGMLQRSRQNRKEYALFIAGEQQEEVAGKTYEIPLSSVMGMNIRFDSVPGKKSFSHTHWDQEGTPLPTGGDYSMFGNMNAAGWECRVVSWLPDGKVFVYEGIAENI